MESSQMTNGLPASWFPATANNNITRNQREQNIKALPNNYNIYVYKF